MPQPTSATMPARRTVKWRCALVFAVAGIIGAFGGSTVGKMVDGQKLLALFAVLMMIVGALMLRKALGRGQHEGPTRAGQFPEARRHRPGDRRPVGLLRHRRRLPDRPWAHHGDRHADPVRRRFLPCGGDRLRSDHRGQLRLVGLGRLDLAALFIGGGVLGGLLGARLATQLAGRKGALNTVFAGLIFVVAIYMLVRSLNLL